MPQHKALEAIGASLQAQYDRCLSRQKIQHKQTLDPTVDDVRKLAITQRRSTKVCLVPRTLVEREASFLRHSCYLYNTCHSTGRPDSLPLQRPRRPEADRQRGNLGFQRGTCCVFHSIRPLGQSLQTQVSYAFREKYEYYIHVI